MKSNDVQKMHGRRLGIIAKIVIGAVLFFALFLAISGVHSKVSILLTKDQARAFVGILAGVIPIFVVALYVDGTSLWSTLSVRERNNRTALDATLETTSNQSLSLGQLFSHKSRWTDVAVTPFQLLSALLGEVLALSCYLHPMNLLIRAATGSVAALMGLFSLRLLEWVATDEDDLKVQLSGAMSAFLLLLVFAGLIPFIFKIAIF